MSEINIGTDAEGWLRTAHTVTSYVERYAPDGTGGAQNGSAKFPYPAYAVYDLNNGSISMDGAAIVRTTAKLSLPPELWPEAQLWPRYGCWLRPHYVIHPVSLTSAAVDVPFAPLLVESVSRESPGATIQAECSDLMRYCEYSEFDSITVTGSSVLGAGSTYVNFLAWLLSPIPGLTASPDSTYIFPVPGLGSVVTIDPSTGRMRYISDVADNLLADVWIDRSGKWQSQPKAKSRPVSWSIQEGVDGVLISAADSLTSEKTRNYVIVSGESAVSGSIPVSAVAQDGSPSSPTYVSGRFGKRTYRRSSGFVRDPAAASSMASSLLRDQLQFQRKVNVTIPPAPHLDPLDIVIIRAGQGESPIRRQIETISHDLAGGSCQMTTREWDI